MKNQTRYLFILFVVLALLLGACSPASTDTAVETEPQIEVVEEAAPEVEEPAVEEEVAACCMAMTADCLACSEGVSVAEYCEANPETTGCEEFVSDEEEAVAEEITEEEMAMDVADLDPAFATFLADMEAYNTISIEDLNVLMAEAPPFILDVRQPGELEENGWIEGAVNIPLREVADNLAYLPDQDTTIVSYCGSGWRCTIALTALESLGWENVLGLKGGSFGGWVEAGYPIATGEIPELVEMESVDIDPALLASIQHMLHNVPEGFGVITADDLNAAIAENPDLILIDVRRAEEVEDKGHIDAPNVTFIPLEEFVDSQDMWPEDLDAPIAVYCGSGHRSTIAMSILWSYGYTDVRSLKGGYGGWVEAGYPTVGAPEPEDPTAALDEGFQTFLADMEAYNTIGIEDLNVLLAEAPPFILDVRQPGELEENGWIEGAVNIPLREVADNLEYLPSFDTTIVSYCGSGWRCTIALAALEAMGWEDVRGLKGGSFGGWVEAGYPYAEGEIPELVALNEAEPDPELAAQMQTMLQNVPEGYGVITADDLNTMIIENPDLILIDVRRAEEVEENGYIDAPNVTFIPLEQFIADKGMWPEDLDAPIVVYCGSGHRSTIAMAILWSYGYTDVHSLKGGFGGWAEAGYAIATK